LYKASLPIKKDFFVNYIITGTTYNSIIADNPPKGIRALSKDELLASDIRFCSDDKVYVPSETSLGTVLNRMDDQACASGINQLKDKYLCRKAMSSLYPNFYFAKCSLESIPTLDVKGKQVVIKPLKGFFGTGVRFAGPDTDLHALQSDVSREMKAYSRFFPSSVLTSSEFIVEEYIGGDEYAVDMYYDHVGIPRIMNIYRHPEARIAAYAHLMYYTNAGVFESHLQAVTDFFESFGNALSLTNFPIHAEFKLTDRGFIPIEFNPMRYGGFGLADLTWHSYGFNPITAYFEGLAPTWENVWGQRAQENYAFILAYNGKDVDVMHRSPDHDAFRDHLSTKAVLMAYVKLDHRTNPVFAIAYIKSEDEHRMRQLLDTEFNDFF